MSLYRKLLYLSDRKQRFLFGWLAVLFVFASFLDVIGLSLVFPLVLAVDEPSTVRDSSWAGPPLDLLGVEDDTAVMLAVGLGLVIVFLIKNVTLAFIWRYAFGQINLGAAKMATRLVRSHLESPYLFQVEQKNADLVRNAANEVHQMYMGVIRSLLDLIRELSLSVGLLTTLLIVQAIREENPMVTVSVILFVAFAAAGMARVMNRLLTVLGVERAARFAGMISWLNDIWHSPREIKIYGIGGFFSRGFETDAVRYSYTQSRSQLYGQVPRLSLEFVAIAALVILMAGFALSDIELLNALPTLALIVVILVRLMPSASHVISAFGAVRYSASSVDAIYQQLHSAEQAREKHGEIAETVSAPTFERSIELRDVSFRYPGRSEYALSDVNLEILPGEKVAIVGTSGSGKTSLLHLLLGLNSPTTGEVLIDDADMRGGVNSWHRQIGIVPQEIYLRDTTIRENVALGLDDEEIDDRLVLHSLEQARLSSFIESLPDGLETQVGDRGARLSGGQRQRLGLARALYRNPTVLVLDEPTAALDEETEARVLESIFDVAANRTVLMVTHKPYIVKYCDKVITISEGRIESIQENVPGVV